jgi:hypothetical protein
MHLLLWQNCELLPSAHGQNNISDLELLAFGKDNLANGLGDHDFSRHDLIHVGFCADPSAHGGIN